MATISKAQEKRNKDKRAFLESRMARQLVGFQNQYLGDYLNYDLSIIASRANVFAGKSVEELNNHYKGKTLNQLGESKLNKWELDCLNFEYRGYREPVIATSERVITYISLNDKEAAQYQLDNNHITSLGIYKEAKKSYDIKFDKVISGMMQYDFNSYTKVDQIDNGLSGEFEILVWNPNPKALYKTNDLNLQLEGVEFFFHARLIYAQGSINRPHFRFITTTRKTYLTK